MRTKKSVQQRKKASRVRIPPETRDEVLRRCLRRCCVCYGLKGALEVVDGQIAHLDRNRRNAAIENLAYLCLQCHKVYDSTSNRTLSFTAGEIALYRRNLYHALGHEQVEWTITIRADRSQYEPVKEAINEAHEMLRNSGSDDVRISRIVELRSLPQICWSSS